MRRFVPAFLLGILLLQLFSYLPSERWIWIILIAAIITLRWKFFYIPTAIALGLAWALWFMHMQTAWILPDEAEGKTQLVTGYIASIPYTAENITEFLFSLKQLQLEHITQPARGLIRLSWRNQAYENPTQKLQVGDQWALFVRLKKVVGTMNPGGFDYEAHAIQQGVVAQGYVVAKMNHTLLSSHRYHYGLDRIREKLKEKIETVLPVSQTSPWIVALTVGERTGISEENWDVLRNTGTNHLMAIAGLHIGFMAGFAHALTTWIWRRRMRWALWFPAQQAGAIAALCVGLIYSALAGFSLPTQRACIMLSVFLITVLLRRHILAWQAWSVALFIVLLLNPLSVLTDSFWLSFGAVALIIYGMSGRLAPTGWWWKLGRIQWVIAMGLIPFSIWLFQQFSIVSFVANSIAIPWVGFLIVPLCLLGSFLLLFSSSLGGFVLILADKMLGVLWIGLTALAHLPWNSWHQCMPNLFILISASVGIMILFIPIGFPGRYLGILGLLPLFFYKLPSPSLGEAWFTLLDVGQGLSAVVQTQHHLLVFDAGAKLNANYDMGESVVVPFLRSIGAKQVDMLVVSHGDNDHIGGAPAIIKHFPVQSIQTSEPEKLVMPQTRYCLRGETWDWDQVNFTFLYPTKEHLQLGNNSSCVLRITSHNKHILLTGDIEKFAEKNMLDNEKAHLPADILVAPHHGSKTSGLDAFLAAVHPTYVLFPIGYRNRYHFPHASVLAKYDALHAIQLDTVQSGAISFQITANPLKPICYRQLHRHVWNHF